jgi:hypothetical protein
MLRTPSISLPLAEVVALLDATTLFILQLLLARHPEMLDTSDAQQHPMQATALRSPRRVFDAVRELHHALDSYRVLLPDEPTHQGDPVSMTDDDIPF